MSAASQRPRVIAFEGVDGAGKSTVIEIVAAHLRAQGLTVSMPRVGKEHSSRPTRMIRRLTRDRTNLDLQGRAEMLLYAAREAQVLDEHVRPALERGETVLLDRSMLTSVVLGAYGRGLDLGTCEAIVEAASGGLEPDVTLIFDVSPRTSRIRKRLDKVRTGRSRDGGRKGLAGSGLKERVRDGYVAIAARDGLPVFHAERGSPSEVAARVITQLETGTHSEGPSDAEPWWRVDPSLSFEGALATLPELLGLYFSRRLECGRELRAGLFEREPALCIWAADRADPLVERAAAEQPVLALGRFAKAPIADQLRARLRESEPVAVARSLTKIEGAEADRLREALAEAAPGAVVESLSGRSDEFANALRDRCWSRADVHERAISLQLLDDDRSWKRRMKLFERDPAVLIPSLRGLSPERVDPMLARYAAHAPKAVLRALRGRGDAAAHALRETLLETGREVVDSLAGLDDDGAWALRERCATRWPSTVAWSTVGLSADPRTAALLVRCREQGAGDMFLARRLELLARVEGMTISDATREAEELET